MYIPSRFESQNPLWAYRLMNENPFATVIAGTEISHLPLLLEERGEERVLVGHLACANPMAKKIADGSAVAIFHGPNAYITPTWYEHCDVPTWNYAVVHVWGSIRLLTQEAQLIEVLQKLSAKMEGEGGWKFEIPQDFAKPGILQKAIVAFELKIDRLDSKFKLSQNKSARDQEGVRRGLEERGDAQSLAVLQWMKESFSLANQAKKLDEK